MGRNAGPQDRTNQRPRTALRHDPDRAAPPDALPDARDGQPWSVTDPADSRRMQRLPNPVRQLGVPPACSFSGHLGRADPRQGVPPDPRPSARGQPSQPAAVPRRPARRHVHADYAWALPRGTVPLRQARPRARRAASPFSQHETSASLAPEVRGSVRGSELVRHKELVGDEARRVPRGGGCAARGAGHGVGRQVARGGRRGGTGRPRRVPRGRRDRRVVVAPLRRRGRALHRLAPVFERRPRARLGRLRHDERRYVRARVCAFVCSARYARTRVRPCADTTSSTPPPPPPACAADEHAWQGPPASREAEDEAGTAPSAGADPSGAQGDAPQEGEAGTAVANASAPGVGAGGSCLPAGPAAKRAARKTPAPPCSLRCVARRCCICARARECARACSRVLRALVHARMRAGSLVCARACARVLTMSTVCARGANSAHRMQQQSSMSSCTKNWTRSWSRRRCVCVQVLVQRAPPRSAVRTQ